MNVSSNKFLLEEKLTIDCIGEVYSTEPRKVDREGFGE